MKELSEFIAELYHRHPLIVMVYLFLIIVLLVVAGYYLSVALKKLKLFRKKGANPKVEETPDPDKALFDSNYVQQMHLEPNVVELLNARNAADQKFEATAASEDKKSEEEVESSDEDLKVEEVISRPVVQENNEPTKITNSVAESNEVSIASSLPDSGDDLEKQSEQVVVAETKSEFSDQSVSENENKTETVAVSESKEDEAIVDKPAETSDGDEPVVVTSDRPYSGKSLSLADFRLTGQTVTSQSGTSINRREFVRRESTLRTNFYTRSASLDEDRGLARAKIEGNTVSHIDRNTNFDLLHRHFDGVKNDVATAELAPLTKVEPTVQEKEEETKKYSNELLLDLQKERAEAFRKERGIVVEKPNNTEEGSGRTRLGIPDLNLYVDYELSSFGKEGCYPRVDFPRKDSIVRSYRIGWKRQRAFKEENFEQKVRSYLGDSFMVSGDVRLNTGALTKPFEPDIALIETKGKHAIRIDVEIDEPYSGATRRPLHCNGEDIARDRFFTDRGWIVVRFSEFQVHHQELECIRFLVNLIQTIDPVYQFPKEVSSVSHIHPDKFWSLSQAQQWEKSRYREHYLNHDFPLGNPGSGRDRSLNQQEAREEREVEVRGNEVPKHNLLLGYNLENSLQRDRRIFYSDLTENYLVDRVPFSRVSSIIDSFFPKQDPYEEAGLLSPEDPLFGLSDDTVVEIKSAQKKEEAHVAKELRLQIENYFLTGKTSNSRSFTLFDKFIKDHSDLEPYRTAWSIYDENYNVAGTIDLVTQQNGRFSLYGWRVSGKIIDPYAGSPIASDSRRRRGIGILDKIDDTEYNHFCLEMSVYRRILEVRYGMSVDDLFLVVLYPEYPNYYKVRVPYFRDDAQSILESLR